MTLLSFSDCRNKIAIKIQVAEMRFLPRVAGVPLFDSTAESRGASGDDWGTLSGKSQAFFFNSLITMILRVKIGKEDTKPSGKKKNRKWCSEAKMHLLSVRLFQ